MMNDFSETKEADHDAARSWTLVCGSVIRLIEFVTHSLIRDITNKADHSAAIARSLIRDSCVYSLSS